MNLAPWTAITNQIAYRARARVELPFSGRGCDRFGHNGSQRGVDPAGSIRHESFQFWETQGRTSASEQGDSQARKTSCPTPCETDYAAGRRSSTACGWLAGEKVLLRKRKRERHAFQNRVGRPGVAATRSLPGDLIAPLAAGAGRASRA